MTMHSPAGPGSIDFMLGWQCNARCIQCWEAVNRRNGWQPERWKRELDVAVLCGVLSRHAGTLAATTLISFGEPMLHSGFGAILRALLAHRTPDGVQLGISMVTNGSLLHEHPEIVDSPGCLTVSFDAPEAALYEGIRQGLRFDAVLSNMALVARRRCPGRLLYVNMTVFKRNASTVYAMAQLLSSIGFTGLAVIRGAALGLSGLQEEELDPLCPEVHAQIARARRDFPGLTLNDYFHTIDGPWATPVGEHCKLPWMKMDITPDGAAHPCCRSYRVDLGTWPEEQWAGPKMTRLRGQLASFRVDPVEFDQCATCPARGNA